MDEQELPIDHNELFFAYLHPDVAEQARQLWIEDGKPNIISINICQEYDEEKKALIQWVEPWYDTDIDDLDLTDMHDIEDDEDHYEVIPDNNWYDSAVNRLENGDI